MLRVFQRAARRTKKAVNKTHAFIPGESQTLALLRRFVLVIWLVGLLGTAAELFLLGHTEGFWQLIPLGLIFASLLSLAAYGVARRRGCLRH